MDARQIVVVVLLAAAGLVVVLAAVGLLASGDQLPRLHFVTPVTSVAGPLTAAAYAIQLGWGLAAALVVAIVLRTIDAFTTFDQVYVLTHGGPGTSTELISLYGYDQFFRFQQYGYAAAMLLMVAAIVLVFAVIAVRLVRKQVPA